jgi:hypothetical protein
MILIQLRQTRTIKEPIDKSRRPLVAQPPRSLRSPQFAVGTIVGGGRLPAIEYRKLHSSKELADGCRRDFIGKCEDRAGWS